MDSQSKILTTPTKKASKHQENMYTTPTKNATTPITTPCSVKLRRLTLKDCNTSTKRTKRIIRDSTDTNIDIETTPRLNLELSREIQKVFNERNILTSKTKKRVFEAFDELHETAENEKMRIKREQVISEVINSEVKYVSQLRTIINYFIKPTKDKSLLLPEDFDALFGNIEPIYNINKELLDGLNEGHDNITEAFIQIAPYLKLYSVYACDFTKRLMFLQKCGSLTPRFALFVENQETRPEVQCKLSALLITPIQRVPRYILLLRQLLDLTPIDNICYKKLSDCLGQVEEVAQHINKMVEDQENMQRLIELQRSLCKGEPNIITPGRVLKKEGILMSISKNGGHSTKMYVVLMNDIIIFNKMKKSEPKVNSLKCELIFPINKCKVLEILDKGCFRVICENEEIVLYDTQLCETKLWIESLNKSIESYLEDRKTLRKDGSSRRPVKRKDLREYHEEGLSSGRPMKKRKNSTDTLESGSNSTNTKSHNFFLTRRKPLHSNVASKGPSTSQNNSGLSTEVGSRALVSSYPFNGHQVNSSFTFTGMLDGVGTKLKHLFGINKS